MNSVSPKRPSFNGGSARLFAKFLLTLLLTVLALWWIQNKILAYKKIDTTEQIVAAVQEYQYEDYIYQTLEKLAQCESNQNRYAINYLDADGTASFGLFQFKPETFREYGIKYGVIGEKADWNWIMTVIFDEKIQKKLAYEILKNEPEKAKTLWPNCYRKIK